MALLNSSGGVVHDSPEYNSDKKAVLIFSTVRPELTDTSALGNHKR